MFNLNIPTTQSLLGVDTGGVCTTPKTPEILNSLIAMTNPLDNYTFAIVSQQPQQSQTQIINNQQTQQQQQQQPTTQQQQQTQPLTQMINNHQIISQDSSHSSCSGSPLDSPAGTNTTPSVQQTCSQLIKAGLKLSIQSKRKMSSGDSSSGNEQPNSKNSRKSLTGDTSEEDTECRKSPKTGLTPEDEDRRRRRRERNKIAATKCRMKKRERTMNLVSESEQLETQNKDLKSQVQNLESERRKLFEMLKSHGGKCVRPGGYHPPAHLCQSPACRYLSKLEMNDSCNSDQHQMIDQQQQQQQQQQCRTAIPPMNTIKYGRNGLRNHQNHMNNGNTNGGIGIGDSGGGDDLNSVCNPQNPLGILTAIQNSAGDLSGTPNDLLTAGYCKPSPTPQEIGYLDSPTHDINNCLSTHLTSGIVPQHQQLQTVILKSDYIPNCENSNGGTTVDTTTDFVLKNELVDAQSPYTTVQSADRFLFESECESFDIKHNNNNNNNSTNNNNSSSNNNNNIDFHPQLSTTPTGCQAYDNLLIKNDFLSDNAELLAPFGDGTETEFTDLDSGVTGYSHITNGGCLA